MAAPSRLKPPEKGEISFLIPAGILLSVLALAVLLWAALVGPGDSEPAPSLPASALVSPSPDPTPHPVLSDWRLILVNAGTPLPDGYTPPELTQIRSETSVDSRMAPDLNAMLDAARAEGYEPLVCAAYRSFERQRELYEDKIREFLDQGHEQAEAERLAAQWVAPPNTSEHQTGLAVDIVSMDQQVLDENQINSPLQQWLMAHCAEYGFILRYPPEKSAVTGISFEPWHYRYVGREAAREITDSGITLEEYWQQ